jgi:hypothetical protein
MAKYKVLRHIEHNLKHYFPPPDAPGALGGKATLASGGHGLPVPVDASGYIDLTEAEAARLGTNYVVPVPTSPPPGKKR